MRVRLPVTGLFMLALGIATALLAVPGLASQTPLLHSATIPAVQAGHPTATDASAVLVVQRLQAAGLPIDNIMVVDSAEADPDHLLGQPGQYRAKATFHQKQLHGSSERSTDGGGSVEVFASPADLATRQSDLKQKLTSGNAHEVDYASGTVLLRLSDRLQPQDLKAFQTQLSGAAQ